MSKTTMRKLESFEMWIYGRVMKISWTQRLTNDEVLKRVNKRRELLTTNKTRKLKYLGHWCAEREITCYSL